MSFFSNVWSAIVSFFTKFGAALFTAFKPLLVSIAENGGKVLIEAAREAVKASEASGGNGDAKRAAAFAAIVRVLGEKGIPVVANAVYGAIEVVVAELKAAK